jgi:hypothetical protein
VPLPGTSFRFRGDYEQSSHLVSAAGEDKGWETVSSGRKPWYIIHPNSRLRVRWWVIA